MIKNIPISKLKIVKRLSDAPAGAVLQMSFAKEHHPRIVLRVDALEPHRTTRGIVPLEGGGLMIFQTATSLGDCPAVDVTHLVDICVAEGGPIVPIAFSTITDGLFLARFQDGEPTIAIAVFGRGGEAVGGYVSLIGNRIGILENASDIYHLGSMTITERELKNVKV